MNTLYKSFATLGFVAASGIIFSGCGGNEPDSASANVTTKQPPAVNTVKTPPLSTESPTTATLTARDEPVVTTKSTEVVPVTDPPVTTESTATPPPTEPKSMAGKITTTAEFLGIKAPKPVTWIEHPPATSMRAAEFAVPGQDGSDQAQIIVFFFGEGQGGTVEDNIDRWAAQFQAPDGQPVEPQITEFESDELPVTFVELSGEWRSMNAASFTPEQLFLGAVVEAPVGNIFIRFVGPKKTVEANREAYMKFLRELKQTEPMK